MIKHFLVLLALTFINLSIAQTKISLDDAKNYINKEVTICETIQSTYKTQEHKNSLLNMGDVYPKQKLTIVILAKHLKNFNYIPVEYLNGKQICVTGKIYLYEGKPQIKVKNPNQIIVN